MLRPLPSPGVPESALLGIDAAAEWAPFNWEAAAIAVGLRNARLLDVAEQFDFALRDVRGYVGAYDEDVLDWQDRGGYPYGPVDYVIEAIDIALPGLGEVLSRVELIDNDAGSDA